ncbi:uncharacterized protein SAPINGB_P002502 [Magnusiomyces paraingens]|uniref:Acireductone dioxygenase n=1 Tax=Magnusiomyces paraingens TaxID=2606893 RepID=A0A5E8BE89_9ASCO|nr:uncharacterized protein SAPINGB_P002502 [Saprochaete ingens]VVT49905.1 unnamed protein product [Saprochaete ingens]
MKIYYHDDDNTTDKQLPHETSETVSVEELKKLGVLAYHYDNLEDVDKLASERSYVSRDEVLITPESFGADRAIYESKLTSFYAEHLHEDEEIRYILDGAGYFDVRDASQSRWIRALLEKGDLLILPAGIYHRFTLTTENNVKALRLFREEPKWIAYNRPEADGNVYRNEYLKEIGV